MSDNRAERRRQERIARKGQWAKEQEELTIERDWEISEEWKSYQTHVRTEVVPKIESSGMGISIVPKSPEDVDIKFAVELGLMIMMDKPIILCVDPSTVLPEKLRRVADEIVMGYPAEAKDELLAAIERVGESLGKADS